MSPTRVTARFSDGGFPRVSGDEPRSPWRLVYFGSFSPRERG